jgi:hypothetical protein
MKRSEVNFQIYYILNKNKRFEVNGIYKVNKNIFDEHMNIIAIEWSFYLFIKKNL